MSRHRLGRWTWCVAPAVAIMLPIAAAALAEPKETGISYYYDGFEQSLVRPVSRFFDPALLVRKVSGNRREAANVDERDQVRLPSTWWQRRLGYRHVTPEQMLKGPGPGTGPAPGKWKVVKAKTQGVSPGFQIKDSEGTRFAIKFDPKKHPELSTGADVVTSYLYWAAGYNVPDNTIVYFRPEDLEIDPKATVTTLSGSKEPMSHAFLNQILKRVPREQDGRYRAVASRFIKGKPLGEWEYQGRRKDDPEDLIPHQHRREVRGLWIINAWTNHTDCSARNTLDMWVTEGGRSFVRHHLIDFSGCLGSASKDKQTPRNGNEYMVDFGTAATSLLTLGLKRASWEDAVDPGLPSVGFVDSENLDPADWRPFLPNPAFDERTELDILWGARIVGAFTNEHIRAAVAQGKYTDPRATEYLARILMERRDKIVRRWLPTEHAIVETAR